MTFELRAPRADEVPAIAEALNARSRALYGSDDVTAGDVRAWFANPAFDLDRDVLVAVRPDGSIAGYADVGDQADAHTCFWIDLRLHPERGDARVAQALLEAMEARARDRAAPGAVVRGVAEGADEDQKAFFERNGYAAVRHGFRMELALDDPPEPPVWPEGFEVRTFRRGEDDAAVYEAHQDAFADDWAFIRDPYHEWCSWQFREPFDPTLWFLVEHGDELAAICLCRPSYDGDPALGWVSVLGVRRPWRRRGLALALLRLTFAEYRRRGHTRVALSVDAENVTGAVALYERAGMHVVRRGNTYQRTL